MKLFNKSMFVATVLLGSLAMGTASAKNLESQPGFSSTKMSYIVNNGVATLYGSADSGSERSLAERYVSKLDGVDRVINLVTYN